MPTELWDRTYAVNVRGTYLTIKHFLKSVESAQKSSEKELPNVSVIVTEIVRLNGKARINAVAPGWVDTKLIEGRLDDPKEMWREAEATLVLHLELWASIRT
jgi:NAD(P)-dependent dehydrogenase (short-subunit alcohol dehydrogenase family)